MWLVALIRRCIMVVIVFAAPFYYYSLLAPRISQNPSPTSGDIYGIAALFLLPLVFSAFEVTRKDATGVIWGGIFGVSLACSFIYSYNYFIGYPIIAMVFYYPFLSLVFGIGYFYGGMFVGAVFLGLWEWKNSAKIRARERTRAERINELKTIMGGHDSLLSQRKDIEEKISEVTSLDPSNLELKKTSFRSQASTIAGNQISKRLSEIRRQTEETIQSGKMHEPRLLDLEKKMHEFEGELSRCEFELSELESNDPANVGIRLQKLHERWDNLTQEQLEKVRSPNGQGGSRLEHLFKKKLLLGLQILYQRKEIENEGKALAHLDRAVNMSRLEDLVLQLEEKDRQIKRKEPEILTTREELRKLEMEEGNHESAEDPVVQNELSEPEMGGNNNGSTTEPIVRNKLKHGSWQCPRCYRMNSAKAKLCTRCGEPKK